MTRTKINTDALNVAANVKSILDAVTYAAIRTLLSLVPGTDVQAYDANILTTTNTKTVSAKRITPRGSNVLFDQAGTHTIAIASYDWVLLSLQANVTFATTGTPTTAENFWIILFPDATPRTIAWSGDFASFSATLPTISIASKKMIIELIYYSGWKCIGVHNEP